MRLTHCETLDLEEFIGDRVPDYAILSHTWGSDEVTFAVFNFDKESALRNASFKKIAYTCRQAMADGLEYAWVDTICIDKTSSSELPEAINSMFNWYQRASICYAYLVDVTADQLLRLFGPLLFYDKTWRSLGSRTQHAQILETVTSINKTVFVRQFDHPLHNFSVATRMAWAPKRQTTRLEDMAYCLLGIFDVNMPLLYGEGNKAFTRLQQEIIKAVDDDSIFAWGLRTAMKETDMDDVIAEQGWNLSMVSILASKPEDFTDCHNMIVVDSMSAYTMANMGLNITLPLIRGLKTNGVPRNDQEYSIGLLTCKVSKFDAILAILLAPVHGSTGLMRRVGFRDARRPAAKTISTSAVGARLAMHAVVREITITTAPYKSRIMDAPFFLRKLIVNPAIELAGFQYYITRAVHLQLETSEVLSKRLVWDSHTSVVTVSDFDPYRIVEIILQSDCEDDEKWYPFSIFVQGEQAVIHHGLSPSMQSKRRICLALSDVWRLDSGNLQNPGFSDKHGRRWVLIPVCSKPKTIHHWDMVSIDVHVLDVTGVAEHEVAAQCDKKMSELENASEQ